MYVNDAGAPLMRLFMKRISASIARGITTVSLGVDLLRLDDELGALDGVVGLARELQVLLRLGGCGSRSS